MLKIALSSSLQEPIPVPLSARLKHNLIGYHLTQLLIFLSRYHQSLPPRVARTVHYLTHPSFPARANAPPRVGAQVGDGAGMAQVVDASVSQEKESELRLAVEKPELPERPSFIEQGGWTLAQQGYAPEQRRIGASTEDEVSQSAQEKLTGQSIGNGTGIVFPPAPSSSTRVSASSLEPLDPQHPTSITINVSHVVFNMDCLFPQYTDEWGIPFEHSAAALRAMRDWLDEEERNADGVRIHFPVEIRFTDADDIWLSHCQGRRTCFIGVIQFR